LAAWRQCGIIGGSTTVGSGGGSGSAAATTVLPPLANTVAMKTPAATAMAGDQKTINNQLNQQWQRRQK
jgi:hypothetical protein